VINAVLLYFVGMLMGSYFEVDSFRFAFLGALIISLVSVALNILTGLGGTRVSIQRQQRRPKDSDDSGNGPVIDI